MTKQTQRFLIFGVVCVVIFIFAGIVLVLQTQRLQVAEDEVKRLSVQKDNQVQLDQIAALTKDNLELRKQLQAQAANEEVKVQDDLLNFLEIYYDKEYTSKNGNAAMKERYNAIKPLCTESGYEFFAPAALLNELDQMDNLTDGREENEDNNYLSKLGDSEVFYKLIDASTAEIFVFYEVDTFFNPGQNGSIQSTTNYALNMQMKYDAEVNRWLCDTVKYNKMLRDDGEYSSLRR